MIRKIRIVQLHSAGFTSVGLGAILPEIRLLDLPFLFKSDQEVDHVYKAMNDYFVECFKERILFSRLGCGRMDSSLIAITY